jgi:hypothetical protein
MPHVRGAGVSHRRGSDQTDAGEAPYIVAKVLYSIKYNGGTETAFCSQLQ